MIYPKAIGVTQGAVENHIWGYTQLAVLSRRAWAAAGPLPR
jgi:hypothetical protein